MHTHQLATVNSMPEITQSTDKDGVTFTTIRKGMFEFFVSDRPGADRDVVFAIGDGFFSTTLKELKGAPTDFVQTVAALEQILTQA